MQPGFDIDHPLWLDVISIVVKCYGGVTIIPSPFQFKAERTFVCVSHHFAGSFRRCQYENQAQSHERWFCMF